jgi:uncharacterized protein
MTHTHDQRDPAHSGPTFTELVARRYRRRDVMAAALLALPFTTRRASAQRPATTPDVEPFRFDEVPASTADTFTVPKGHRAQVLLRWGDPIVPGAPAFDHRRQTAAAQRGQFGFGCDFNAYFPLADEGEGLLCTNHEYITASDLFAEPARDAAEASERFQIELEAHGHTVAHLVRGPGGLLTLRADSRYNRRITGSTPLRFDGPAAGSAHLMTNADPSAERPLGTLANCGGGRTPWGTVLTCEENYDEYFGRVEELKDPDLVARLARAGITPGKEAYGWYAHDPRFDLTVEPNEPNRFGWVVEIDPFDPKSVPVKHTALGRFEHEAAACALADDGRLVVYMGDDDRFEYLYKYVSDGVFDSIDRAANTTLLQRGTLYVARLSVDGTGEWLPLVPQGPLEDWSQADICVHTRAAADLLGATPMDRPEGIEVSPLTQAVYVCLTNNSKRAAGDGAANPRAQNLHGQVLELLEGGGDLGATRFGWSLLMVCGDPADASDEDVSYGGARDPEGTALSCPDNVAIDAHGNLWIATDGQPKTLGVNDAVYAVPTGGAQRGRPTRFATGPIGCELTGPCLAEEGRTLFLSVQHPGGGGGLVEPTSTWPHDDSGIPRPSVVAITRADGRPLA